MTWQGPRSCFHLRYQSYDQVEHFWRPEAADWIADDNTREDGHRQTPLRRGMTRSGKSVTSIAHLMQDRGHTLIIIGCPPPPPYRRAAKSAPPGTEKRSGLRRIPLGIRRDHHVDPSFQAAIVPMNEHTNGQILALCGPAEDRSPAAFFRHVRWSLLPLPVVYWGSSGHWVPWASSISHGNDHICRIFPS